MDLPELVRHMCQRPSMWVRPPDFSSVCTFIDGFDYARDGGPLDGFREWLIVRLDGGNNLTWTGLVEMAIREADPIGSLMEDQEASRLQAMAVLFDEFFRFRDEDEGVTKIYHEYARWLLRQSWYTGSLRKTRK